MEVVEESFILELTCALCSFVVSQWGERVHAVHFSKGQGHNGQDMVNKNTSCNEGLHIKLRQKVKEREKIMKRWNNPIGL